MQNLLNELVEVLQQDQSLLSDGKLLKAAVIERSDKLDPALLKLLLGSGPLKRALFAEVDGVLVFDKVRFADFVSNKEFLPDSYTAFRNHIGLTDRQGRFVSRTNDVVLAWPYKDCVLEGGMTKEEAGRDELFWNTTLAPDDVTRLFEPKALHRFKRWDAEAVAAGKPKPAGVIGEDDNLLIKGNNLLALHSLKQRYAGRVKLIYIDPPFNTGNDSFKYNDRFRHSSWLNFFANRIDVLFKLLCAAGVLVVQLDDREHAYAKVVLDELFGRDNFVNSVTVRTNSAFGFKSTSDSLFKQASHLLIYSRNKSSLTMPPLYVRRSYDPQYRFVFEDIDLPEREWTWTGIQDAAAKAEGHASQADAIKALSKVRFEERVAQFALDNAERVFRTASVTGGALRKRAKTIENSQRSRTTILRHPNDDMDYMFIGGERVLMYADRVVEVDGERFAGELVTDIWNDIAIEGTANEGGVAFPKGKKPEQLLRRIIELFTVKGDIVLDCFAGSGTTAAVAQKLRRRWITTEQMDYTGELPAKRLRNVIAGDATGISAAVDWEGGGSFVYAELAEWNEALGRRIRNAADDAALRAVADKVKATGYWHYKTDKDRFDWDAFATLPFDERKQVLLDSLDANHLYVNYGDIADEAYGMSDEDIRVNRAFYGDAG